MAMKTSQDRILTTHVGSLPRPPELKELLVRKDQSQSYDKAALDRVTRQAVLDIVRRQAQTGIDIVNDGEMSTTGSRGLPGTSRRCRASTRATTRTFLPPMSG